MMQKLLWSNQENLFQKYQKRRDQILKNIGILQGQATTILEEKKKVQLGSRHLFI